MSFKRESDDISTINLVKVEHLKVWGGGLLLVNLGRTDFLWAGLTVVMQVTASVNFQGTLITSTVLWSFKLCWPDIRRSVSSPDFTRSLLVFWPLFWTPDFMLILWFNHMRHSMVPFEFTPKIIYKLRNAWFVLKLTDSNIHDTDSDTTVKVSFFGDI